MYICVKYLWHSLLPVSLHPLISKHYKTAGFMSHLGQERSAAGDEGKHHLYPCHYMSCLFLISGLLYFHLILCFFKLFSIYSRICFIVSVNDEKLILPIIPINVQINKKYLYRLDWDYWAKNPRKSDHSFLFISCGDKHAHHLAIQNQWYLS